MIKVIAYIVTGLVYFVVPALAACLVWELVVPGAWYFGLVSTLVSYLCMECGKATIDYFFPPNERIIIELQGVTSEDSAEYQAVNQKIKDILDDRHE